MTNIDTPVDVAEFMKNEPIDLQERDVIVHAVQKMWSRLSWLSQGQTTRAETVAALAALQEQLTALQVALSAVHGG